MIGAAGAGGEVGATGAGVVVDANATWAWGIVVVMSREAAAVGSGAGCAAGASATGVARGFTGMVGFAMEAIRLAMDDASELVMLTALVGSWKTLACLVV